MIEATCITCGHAFTPAPDAFRRGTWRTCTRCRGDPDAKASGTLDDSKRSQAQITRPKCQPVKGTNAMTTAAERQERIHELRNEGIAVPASVYAAMASDRAPETLLRNWGWSAYLWDRPTPNQYVGVENALASDQDAWDAAHQSISGSLELRAERQQQEAKAQRQRETADAAKRTAEADQIKAELRERFLRLPGTSPEEFEREFPALLSDHRRQAMQRNDDVVRSELQRITRAGL